MDTITNTTTINSVDDFIASASEAKKYGINRIWDIPLDVLKEIIEGDALDIIYNNKEV